MRFRPQPLLRRKTIELVAVSTLVIAFAISHEPFHARAMDTPSEGIEVEVSAPEGSIIEAGQPSPVAVVVRNTSTRAVRDLLLVVNYPTSVVAEVTLAQTTPIPTTRDAETGRITWFIDELSGEEARTFEISVLATDLINVQGELRIEASALRNDVTLATHSVVLKPPATLAITRSIQRDEERAVPGNVARVKLEVVSNIQTVELVIEERVVLGSPGKTVQILPVLGAETAVVRSGGITWTITAPNPGTPFELSYDAFFPNSNNLSSLIVTRTASVLSGTRVLVSQSDEYVVPGPVVAIVRRHHEDLDGDNSIEPGDRVRFVITIENQGSTSAGGTSVVETVDEAVVAKIENISAGGKPSGSGVRWDNLSIPTHDSLDLQYEVIINDLDEQKDVTPEAIVLLGNTILDRGSDQYHVSLPTDDSDRQLWFWLIVFFLGAAFTAVVVATLRRKGISGDILQLGAMAMIVAAILILAFGLGLDSEIALGILGTIAGYVLGQRVGGDGGAVAGGEVGERSPGPPLKGRRLAWFWTSIALLVPGVAWFVLAIAEAEDRGQVIPAAILVGIATAGIVSNLPWARRE